MRMTPLLKSFSERITSCFGLLPPALADCLKWDRAARNPSDLRMATGIAFPTVPEGKARIRTIMTSEHTRPQIDQALEIITTTAKKSGVLV